MTAMSLATSVQLRSRITCPHCWTEFAPDEVLWISTHTELRGDPLLSQDEQQRFLPSRFNADGKAIDVRGEICKDLACPHCHLSLSWSFLEMRPLFISILGAPGSGKSYFLAAMTWHLRHLLHNRFALGFADADPLCNQVLSEYEQRLFLSANDDQLVYLPKTELEGQLYQSVNYGDRHIFYPRPFVFSVQPLEGHIDFDKRRALSRAVCLYDNAGEHFLPGGETSNNPSQHLALSEVLFFLFDPSQHPKFRKQCKGRTNDPQMGNHGGSHRQDLVLLEAASRIRRHSGWSQSDKYKHPLIVVLTKLDAWRCLVPDLNLDLQHVIRKVSPTMAALDARAVQDVSDRLRILLTQLAPEMVAAAEGFSDQVTYLPVSALGREPEVSDTQGLLGIRPKDIQPVWAAMPMLFALSHSTQGLVRSAVRRSDSSSSLPEADCGKQYQTPSGQAGKTPVPPPRFRETGS